MNITIYQGESKSLVYELTDDVGNPVDLTFIDAEWRLTGRTDETPLIIKTLGAGITYTDAALGLLTVELTPEDTELAPGLYRRELRLSSGSTQRHTADTGTIKIVDSLFITG